LAESLLAYESKRFVKMAALLSFAIMLKVFPAILLLIFCFRRQFRIAALVSIFCATLFLASVALTGLDVWVFCLTKVLPKAANGEIAGAFVDNYQSVFMFLKRVFVFDQTLNRESVFNSPSFFSALLFGFKILVLLTGWFITKNNNNLTVFSYWIFAAIVLSPYGSTYTFVLLIFAFFTIASAQLTMTRNLIFIGLIFLVSNFPLQMVKKLQFPFSYGRLFFLLALMFVFVALLSKPMRWKIITPIAVLSTVLAFFLTAKHSTSPRHLFLNAPILIYDYKLQNNKLTYFYWDEKGENSHSTVFKYKNAVPLELKHNQVYHNGKKLTDDHSNKLKPVLLDDNSIILLTDAERGIGFYTLKIIDLNKIRRQ
jgi:hypothetical protein